MQDIRSARRTFEKFYLKSEQATTEDIYGNANSYRDMSH